MKRLFYGLLLSLLLLGACAKGKIYVKVTDDRTYKSTIVDQIEIKDGKKSKAKLTNVSDLVSPNLRRNRMYTVIVTDKTEVLDSQFVYLDVKDKVVNSRITRPLLSFRILDNDTDKPVGKAQVTITNSYGAQVGSLNYPTQTELDFLKGAYNVKVVAQNYEPFERSMVLGKENVIYLIPIRKPMTVNFMVKDEESGSEITEPTTIRILTGQKKIYEIDYPTVTKFQLPDGQYNIEADCPGYQTHKGKLDVSAKPEAISYNVILKPLTWKLTLKFVDSKTGEDINNVKVYIAGESFDRNSGQSLSLRQDQYSIRTEKSGYKEFILEKFLLDQDISHTIRLEKLPPSNWGLTLKFVDAYTGAALSGVQVSLNGTGYSWASGTKKTLSAGAYNITASKDNYYNSSLSITLNSDQTYTMKLQGSVEWWDVPIPGKRDTWTATSTHTYRLKSSSSRGRVTAEFYLKNGSKKTMIFAFGKSDGYSAAGPSSMTLAQMISAAGLTSGQIEKIVCSQ